MVNLKKNKMTLFYRDFGKCSKSAHVNLDHHRPVLVINQPIHILSVVRYKCQGMMLNENTINLL